MSTMLEHENEMYYIFLLHFHFTLYFHCLFKYLDNINKYLNL